MKLQSSVVLFLTALGMVEVFLSAVIQHLIKLDRVRRADKFQRKAVVDTIEYSDVIYDLGTFLFATLTELIHCSLRRISFAICRERQISLSFIRY
jgi:hypothetical protein